MFFAWLCHEKAQSKAPVKWSSLIDMTFSTAYLISRYKKRLSELIAIEMSALTTPNFITSIHTISYGVALGWPWDMDG